jgi:CheY-like chemotaxis protein
MMRVLVADDCRDTADMFALLLTTWGHEAEAAYDGAEALAKAEAARPDVALLDLDMPGMSGGEVARRLRAGQSGRPWLVAVTGLHPAKLPREDGAAFHARLTKPVEPGDLMELLRAAEAAAKRAP